MLPEMSVPKSAKPRASMPVHEKRLEGAFCIFRSSIEALFFAHTHVLACRNTSANRLCAIEENREHIGMDKVVGVDKQEVFALSFFNTKIARGRNPAVFLMENPNAIIGRSQLFAKLGGTIGRTVINEDNLEVTHCL